MNPLDTILSTLVDSAFPITKEFPCSTDCPPLLRLLNPVVYSDSAKSAVDANDT